LVFNTVITHRIIFCRGSFTKGIPQSRVVGWAGPSGSGKTFNVCNAMREAQKDGAFVVVLDSENALDETFMSNLGVDISPTKLMYFGVVTIQDVTKVMSDFITGYEKEYGRTNKDAPKVFIVLDSLDMLLTEGENEKFEKGAQTGDMGQRAKLTKHLLRTITQRVSRLNMTFVFTHQVYPMDPMLGQGSWAINNAVKYCASSIALVTKLSLKDDTGIAGIRMRVETYKSRFAKLGSKIEIDVPYEKGMDPLSGVIDLLIAKNIIESAGAWMTFHDPIDGPKKFQRKTFTEEIFMNILARSPILQEEEKLIANDSHTAEILSESKPIDGDETSQDNE